MVESKSYFDKYFMEGLEGSTPEFDILLWSKVNSSEYPILSNIARNVLAILIFTIASESAFSVGSHVLDSFHNSLTPITIETLICTQIRLKASFINYDSQDVMGYAKSYKLEIDNIHI